MFKYSKTLAAMAALLALALTAAPVRGAEEEKENPRGENETVIWLSYDEGLRTAKEKGLPVMLFFYSENCRKCELLEEKGFQRNDIACYVNRKLAPVRLKDKDHRDLVKEYGAAAFPTVWFLTPEAERIDFFVGYVPPDRLMLIIEYVGEKAYQNMSFKEFEEQEGG